MSYQLFQKIARKTGALQVFVQNWHKVFQKCSEKFMIQHLSALQVKLVIFRCLLVRIWAKTLCLADTPLMSWQISVQQAMQQLPSPHCSACCHRREKCRNPEGTTVLKLMASGPFSSCESSDVCSKPRFTPPIWIKHVFESQWNAMVKGKYTSCAQYHQTRDAVTPLEGDSMLCSKLDLSLQGSETFERGRSSVEATCF